MAQDDKEYFDSDTRKNNVIYNKFVVSKKLVKSPATNIVRAKFYRLRKYKDVDGVEHTYSDVMAPIIFTLFVSKAQDIVHAVKISEIRPELIKRFFSKFVNTKTELLEIKGDARSVYDKKVANAPAITNQGYRTYKLSGIRQAFELDMDETELTPKSKQAKGINKKSQIKNR